ncbi:MAG: hypothetical protein GOVbin7368_20 [Prokaryotic dsDNA virus sp.]|nr:MAG: hypothetical protein GOVbin7368_20 [Prokaryotic dsDNA virus sp.]
MGVADVIPAFLRWPLALACAAVLAFGAGWWAGARDARHRAAESRADNIKTGQEIRNDVEGLDDPAYSDELDGRLSPAGE